MFHDVGHSVARPAGPSSEVVGAVKVMEVDFDAALESALAADGRDVGNAAAVHRLLNFIAHGRCNHAWLADDSPHTVDNYICMRYIYGG